MELNSYLYFFVSGSVAVGDALDGVSGVVSLLSGNAELRRNIMVLRSIVCGVNGFIKC